MDSSHVDASDATWQKLVQRDMVVECILGIAIAALVLFRFSIKYSAHRFGGRVAAATVEELASCGYLTLILILLEVDIVRQGRKRRQQGSVNASASDAQWHLGLLCMCM